MLRTKLAVIAVALLLSVSPMAVGFLVQGHSPITILLTDPQGNQFGCTSATCTPPNSTYPNGINFVDSLPASECLPGGCSYQVVSSGGDNVTNIVIPNATIGSWGVQYFGTNKGNFSVVLLNCPEGGSGTNDSGNPNQGHFEPGCGKKSSGVINGVATTGAQSICDKSSAYYALNVCDPDDSGYFFISTGSVTQGSVGSLSVNYNSNGSLTVPNVVKSVTIFGPTTITAGVYAQYQGTVLVQPGSAGSGLPVYWFLDGVNVFNTTTAQMTAPNTYYFNFGENFSPGSHSIYAVCEGVQSNVISFNAVS